MARKRKKELGPFVAASLLILIGCTPNRPVFTPASTYTPTSTSASTSAPPTASGAATTASYQVGADILARTDCVTDIALDTQNIYWSTCSGAVLMIPKIGGEVRLLAAEQLSPRTLLVDNESVFWLNGTGVSETTLVRVCKNGGEVSTMAKDPNRVTSIAVDEVNLYWSTCSESDDVRSGTVMRMLKNGGTPEVVVSEAVCPEHLALDDTTIYWVDGGLKAIDMDGGTSVTLLSDTDLLEDDVRRDLHLSIMSKKQTRVNVAEIIKVDRTYVYFTIFTDNTGLISCKDNHTRLARMPKVSYQSASQERMPEPLAWMPERVEEFASDDSSMYLRGRCDIRPEIWRMSNSGERAVVKLVASSRGVQQDYRMHFVVDRMSIYYWDAGNSLLRKVRKQTEE